VRKFTIAVGTAALIGPLASAATAATWNDGVTQAPSSLGLTADGSYAYTHLRWGQLNTAGAESRTADGDIYQRVCWAACQKWRVTGHVTLTFAGAIRAKWSVAKITARFMPRWRHLEQPETGVYAAGTHYAEIIGAGASIPQFYPYLISRRAYLIRLAVAESTRGAALAH
jgi:hypothetical protein